jgi:hypothetical protein
MKKILVALFLSLIFSSSLLYADQATFMRNMAHVNPVPNYMSIIKVNADKLGLNDEQKAKVLDWKNKKGKKMAAMVQGVMDAEAKIKAASIEGSDAKEITTMAQDLMDKRMKIITNKTECRDYMSNILTKAQWKQLMAIVKAM